MGVSIHYRGRLDESTQLPALIEELSDFASAMKWEHQVLDTSWDEPPSAKIDFAEGQATIVGNIGLKGILLSTDDDCEAPTFYFDANGKLRNVMSMLSYPGDASDDSSPWVSVKTQYSDAKRHIWLIALLKYLKRHYISNLEVSDESDYWETQDEQALQESLSYLKQMIEQLGEDIGSLPRTQVSEASSEDLANLIENLIRRKGESRKA